MNGGHGEYGDGRGGGLVRRLWSWRQVTCVLILWFAAIEGSYAQPRSTDPLPAPLSETVGVEPSPLVLRTEVGIEFSWDIYVHAGTALVNAADLHLSFDPEFLQVTRAASPGALPSVAASRYDNLAGAIDFGAYVAGGDVTGSFKLCTIYFRASQATSAAGTIISSDDAPLVVGPGGVSLATDWTDGQVVVTEPVWHVEAEHKVAVAVRPILVGEDAGASSCLYLYCPVGESSCAVVHAFRVPDDGQYYLWARAMGLGWQNNSFLVSMDYGASSRFAISPVGGVWTWVWKRVGTYTLAAGKHTVRFAADEPGARVDRILLADASGFVPRGVGLCPLTLEAPAESGPVRALGGGF